MCQSLAQFIKWSDDILLHGEKGLNKENAHKLITALSEGVEVTHSFIRIPNHIGVKPPFKLHRCVDKK